jgi:hypothetical protein
MKAILTFILLAMVASISLSCRRADRTPLTAEQIEQNARAYLQPLLHSGDSTTNIIARFGHPEYQYVTGMHEQAMYFLFPRTDHAALAAGVGGFTGFFTNSYLAHWEPIYAQLN